MSAIFKFISKNENNYTFKKQIIWTTHKDIILHVTSTFFLKHVIQEQTVWYYCARKLYPQWKHLTYISYIRGFLLTIFACIMFKYFKNISYSSFYISNVERLTTCYCCSIHIRRQGRSQTLTHWKVWLRHHYADASSTG